jgi:hypothetical protein
VTTDAALPTVVAHEVAVVNPEVPTVEHPVRPHQVGPADGLGREEPWGPRRELCREGTGRLVEPGRCPAHTWGSQRVHEIACGVYELYR